MQKLEYAIVDGTEKEVTKKVKLVSMLCSSLALMVSICLCTLYMLLWMQAMNANKMFSIGEAYSEQANYYDTCSIGE